MFHITTKSSGVAAIALLAISLACLGLAACGGSSGGSSSSSSTASTAAAAAATGTTSASTPPPSTTTTEEGGPPTATDRRRRVVALKVVKCMRNYGVNVPEPGPKGYIAVGGSIAGTPQFKTAVAQCQTLLTEAAQVK